MEDHNVDGENGKARQVPELKECVGFYFALLKKTETLSFGSKLNWITSHTLERRREIDESVDGAFEPDSAGTTEESKLKYYNSERRKGAHQRQYSFPLSRVT
jgi:hypothetical protein